MLNNISVLNNSSMITLPFLQFDKIYATYNEMRENEKTDGVFINRFILIKNDKQGVEEEDIVFDNYDSTVWVKQYKTSTEAEAGSGYYQLVANLKPHIPISNYGVIEIDKYGIVHFIGSSYSQSQKNIKTLQVSITLPEPPAVYNYINLNADIEKELRKKSKDSSDTPISSNYVYYVKVQILNYNGEEEALLDDGLWEPVFNSSSGGTTPELVLWNKIY